MSVLAFPDRIAALKRLDEAYAQEAEAALVFHDARLRKSDDRGVLAQRWIASQRAVRDAQEAVPRCCSLSQSASPHRRR